MTKKLFNLSWYICAIKLSWHISQPPDHMESMLDWTIRQCYYEIDGTVSILTPSAHGPNLSCASGDIMIVLHPTSLIIRPIQDPLKKSTFQSGGHRISPSHSAHSLEYLLCAQMQKNQLRIIIFEIDKPTFDFKLVHLHRTNDISNRDL